jgi:hypothetical protein
MNDHILVNAKAYAALVGSVLTAVIAGLTNVPTWLTIVAAVCTAVATWAVPNTAPARDEAGAVDIGLGLLIVAVLGIALLLFGVRFDR